jgi:CBS-domain-containing membrane protein
VYLRGADGQIRIVCSLAPGVCALQGREKIQGRRDVILCREPCAVSTDWQEVELEALPTEEVRAHMTAEPVTVGPQTPIGTLAQMMLDSRIHRVIVTDQARRPIGIVSSTNILAALSKWAAELRKRKQKAYQRDTFVGGAH